MSPARLVRLLPAFLARRLLSVESRIDDAVESFAASFPPRARVLDAGCGEAAYRVCFEGRVYVGLDHALGDPNGDYSGIDARADLAALPFKNASFDGALNIVVLEHTADPARVLCEIARTLKPGGRLLLVVPQQWEVHQAPHDYFRFTRFGLERLLGQSGFAAPRIEPLGGFFTLAARRCLNFATFFMRGLGWIVFPFVAALAALFALVLPLFDPLDRERHFTLGYVCWVEKL